MSTETSSSESNVTIHHCVAGFAFCECPGHEHIALIEKKKPTFHAGMLNGIGGHIEVGESPLEAMRREFREETGVNIEKWNQFAHLVVGNWRVHMFRAFNNKILDVRTTTDEQVRLLCRSGLYRLNCVPNLAWLIPMALNLGVVMAEVTELERY